MKNAIYLFVLFTSFITIPNYIMAGPTFSVESLATTKEEEILTTGKYTQVPKGEIDQNVEIHVYETPAKMWGYEIIEYGDGWVEHTGYGPEGKERTFLSITPKYEEMVASTTIDM